MSTELTTALDRREAAIRELQYCPAVFLEIVNRKMSCTITPMVQPHYDGTRYGIAVRVGKRLVHRINNVGDYFRALDMCERFCTALSDAGATVKVLP